MFLSLLIPFILVSNFFPFFRYGMFAEAIRSPGQAERFVICTTGVNGEKYVVSPISIGLSEASFESIVRNYYYQNKLQQLFSQLGAIQKKTRPDTQWVLFRVVESSSSNKIDTVDTQIWPKHE